MWDSEPWTLDSSCCQNLRGHFPLKVGVSFVVALSMGTHSLLAYLLWKKRQLNSLEKSFGDDLGFSSGI